MQLNQLDLAVDAANDGNPASELYDRRDEYQNRSVYIGTNHVPEARDEIALYRTYATKSGNFKGVLKSTVKFTEDIVVPGVDGVSQLTVPMIAELSFSLPVGVTPAQACHIRQRVIAMADDDSLMDSINIKQMV